MALLTPNQKAATPTCKGPTVQSQVHAGEPSRIVFCSHSLTTQGPDHEQTASDSAPTGGHGTGRVRQRQRRIVRARCVGHGRCLGRRPRVERTVDRGRPLASARRRGIRACPGGFGTYLRAFIHTAPRHGRGPARWAREFSATAPTVNEAAGQQRKWPCMRSFRDTAPTGFRARLSHPPRRTKNIAGTAIGQIFKRARLAPPSWCRMPEKSSEWQRCSLQRYSSAARRPSFLPKTKRTSLSHWRPIERFA